MFTILLVLVIEFREAFVGVLGSSFLGRKAVASFIFKFKRDVILFRGIAFSESLFLIWARFILVFVAKRDISNTGGGGGRSIRGNTVL